jgi:uncharacterized protein YbaP (TraB family)
MHPFRRLSYCCRKLSYFCRRLSYFCALLAATAVSNGQQPLPHTLLWRISGNGQTRPSYLFGTIHLNDRRLFRLDDSVYTAIGATDGFAMEVNPDDLGAYMANNVFDRITNSPKLKDIVDEKYFNKNKAALSKKFNKAAEDITTNDVLKEKNKWMMDLIDKGEMTTFLDAYLYNIAWRQGKWVGGIEDIGDQSGLLNAVVDQSDVESLLAADPAARASDKQGTAEKMISLYSNQDPDGLKKISIEHFTDEQKEGLVTSRNAKMTRRIDSLTTLRTMFVAIGAAHLAGDSGLISLLRRRGFVVTPVFSTHKIDTKDYTFKEVHLPWVGVEDPQGFYTVDMPANPTTIDIYGLVKVKYLFDVFNLSGYCTMVVINHNSSAGKDSLFNSFALRLFKDEHLGYKSLEKNGLEGREYTGKLKNHPFRCQLFMDEHLVYIAMLNCIKEEAFTSPEADKFFASFSINKKPAPAQVSRRYTDPIMGISFVTPVALAYNKKLSDPDSGGWETSAFSGVDIPHGAYVVLISKQIKAGYGSVSDSTDYDALLGQMKDECSDIQQREVEIQGYKGVKFIGRMKAHQNLYLNELLIFRNNKEIVLYCMADAKHLHSPAMDSLFSSFVFTQPPVSGWTWNSEPDSLFTCWAPSSFRKASPEDKLTSVAYDTATALSYYVLPQPIGRYNWYASDSQFWEMEVKQVVGSDSLIEEKDVVNGAIKGKELLIRNREAHNYNRIRMLINGDKIVELYLYGSKELLFSVNTDKFFNSFRLNGAPVPGYITASKTGYIIVDLTGKDTATRLSAFNAIGTAAFRKEDLPLLQLALFKRFLSPYDSTLSTMVNQTLAKLIAGINDPSSIAFVKEQYPLFVRENEDLKDIGLSVLADMHTKESFAALAELWVRSPPIEEISGGTQIDLEDNLALTAGIYPILQQLARNPIHASYIAKLALKLMDSGYIEKGTFYAAAGDYLLVKDRYILKAVVLQLIENDQQVPRSAINRIAADNALRGEFYADLKKMKKTALFPGEYMTQTRFAEAAIYDAAENPEMDSVTIRFVRKETAGYKGKKYVFYLYKVGTYSEGIPYETLGIAGGYDLTGIKLEPLEDLAGVYYDERFDANRLFFQFGAYLKSKSKKAD